MKASLGSKITGVAAAGIAAVLVLASCGDASSNGASDHADRAVEVVATVSPGAAAATRVGGDRVHVTNLTPPGVEPHDIELTTRQVDAIENADLLVYLGGGFQPAVSEVAKGRKRASVDVAGSVTLETGALKDLGEAGIVADPHFWLDPTLMSRAVQRTADALAAASPPDEPAFRAGAQRYANDLNTLDGEFRRGLADCDRKEIVTSHAAFFYLAKRYGLTQLAVAGVSPEAEPDAARLATLAAEIKSKGITTVFFEDLVSPKVAETLAREAKVRTAVLSPLEGLSPADAAAGKDYISVMRDNLTAIRLALGCR
jgi:zinc transport system substrate-binding protein